MFDQSGDVTLAFIKSVASGRRAEPPEYNVGVDLNGSFFGGAIAEKGNSRIVVIGSGFFAVDTFVTFRDEALEEKEIYSPRFPGNGELFMNSVFWLAKQDTMVSLSANALDVNRVGDVGVMDHGYFKYTVLIGVPVILVLSAGLWMFFSRRD